MVRAIHVSRRQSGLAVLGVMMLMAAAGGASVAQAADELPKESVLPASLAGKAAQAAVDFCKKDGYRVSASVVDRAGVLRAMLRADGAGPHTVDSSRKKAYTAASLRRATTELAAGCPSKSPVKWWGRSESVGPRALIWMMPVPKPVSMPSEPLRRCLRENETNAREGAEPDGDRLAPRPGRLQ